MTTKELSERQIWWSQTLSQFDIKIEYRPGKEGGKSDAQTRRPGDLPQEGDERIKQKQRILLLKEYFEDTKIEEMELIEFQDNDREYIKEASKDDETIQRIKTALEKGEKQLREVVLGLCQWKDRYL